MLHTVSELKRFFIEQNSNLGDEFTDLDPNLSLLENGLIDSINLMKLINFIEQTFKIKIDEEEMTPSNFDTLNSISKLVNKQFEKLTEKYPN